jgi:hypothetical protein
MVLLLAAIQRVRRLHVAALAVGRSPLFERE